MKRFSIRRWISCFLVQLIFTVALGGGSSAHVEDESMPDSVAEVEYRIFLEFRPNNSEVRNKLGMVLYRRNKLKEAAREFSRVLKLKPDDFDALDAMGLVKAAQQQYDQAIKYHRAAMALNPDDPLVHYHLGTALEKSGQNAEAAAAYQAALTRLGALHPGTRNEKAARIEERIRTAIAGLRDYAPLQEVVP